MSSICWEQLKSTGADRTGGRQNSPSTAQVVEVECKQGDVEDYAPGVYVNGEERVTGLWRGVLHGSDWHEPAGGDLVPLQLLALRLLDAMRYARMI